MARRLLLIAALGLLVMELLPASLKGSAMVPPARRAELEEEGKGLQKLLCPAE